MVLLDMKIPRYKHHTPSQINELLLDAIKEGKNDIKNLIQKGADINNNNGYPLQLAIVYGYFDLVKVLVELGADIHADNNLAFVWALIRNDLGIFKYLYKNRKQDVNLDDYTLSEDVKQELLNLSNKVYKLL